ncbi:MAG: AraC family transcriptional regulator [Phycisphaerales bacterium JB052]
MEHRSIQTIVEQFATREGANETEIPGLQLYRISGPIERSPAVYTPRICINTRGAKRVFSKSGVHIYDSEQFICCTMPVPVQVEVPNATPTAPVMGISLDLDTGPCRELIQLISAAQGHSIDFKFESTGPQGLATGPISGTLEEAIRRLLELLYDSTTCRALAQGRLREVYYFLLTGPLGPVFQRRFGVSQTIVETVCYLQDNLTESLSIDHLAKWAGMSRATFHRRFKVITGMTPIQFIKEYRLNSAAMQLAAGMRTGEAADAVGYSSISQFSREFKRQFGQSPREWASRVST